MKVLNFREFKNGSVYAIETFDGYPIETTDTFLPYYTKDAINNNTNKLCTDEIGNRAERWMVGVSCMSGCPVGCKFCATGQLKKWKKLSWNEIVNQVLFVVDKNKNGYKPENAKEFKINYTRMGEPFFNVDAVKKSINVIQGIYPHTHHYISTIGIKGSDFSWIEDNITLQISLHSLDEERRKYLIPINNLMSLKELGSIRTKSKLKTTLNLTLVDEKDFDINRLEKYFDPKYFFIKLSPINPNPISVENNMGNGIIENINLI